jgi:hypothetical protein
VEGARPIQVVAVELEGTLDMAKKLVQGGVSTIIGSILQFTNNWNSYSTDQDDLYRYELNNIWSPSTIIQQCQIQGGAVC